MSKPDAERMDRRVSRVARRHKFLKAMKGEGVVMEERERNCGEAARQSPRLSDMQEMEGAEKLDTPVSRNIKGEQKKELMDRRSRKGVLGKSTWFLLVLIQACAKIHDRQRLSMASN